MGFYTKNIKNLKIGHVNINSIRHKFLPLEEVLKKNVLDILIIQETKLDNSFPVAQFLVDEFVMYRNDFRNDSGGLMMFVRGDLPQRRRNELEVNTCQSGRIESIAVEITTQDKKWLLFNMYKQPIVKDSDFKTIFEDVLKSCTRQGMNYIICGDLNVNMLKPGNCLVDLLDVYGSKNIVKSPTCFKSSVPTLLDVVITNVPKSFQNVSCIECDLSDFHRMVCFATKMYAPVIKKRQIVYRSYKHFDENSYTNDLLNIPFHVCEIFDDVEDSYWFCQEMITDIMNTHAPIKQRIIKNNQVPFMNGKLRKAINVKNMFRRKFNRCRNSVNWEIYRNHRNYVVKLRKECTRIYLKEKGTMSGNGKEFWKIIKPLISNKNVTNNNDIILMENDEIINTRADVCNTMNEYYVNITKSIGCEDSISVNDSFVDIINTHSSHPSVCRIRESISGDSNFSFTMVNTEHVYKKLKNVNSKKAPGFDGMPPKLIKMGASALCNPITWLINRSISSSKFPNLLKYAEVSPIYKKGNSLDKKNYRPVSILPCISKVFESVFIDQMSEFLEPVLSPHLSGFRKEHSCQSVLLHMVDQCKTNMDNNGISGALLTDLSKAFDCLSYKLMIAKLYAYGFNSDACMLVASYFTDRKQRVKLGDVRSEWQQLMKGSPQGSLFGPFSYNLFSNDLLYLIDDLCDIYNYADDNTICVHGKVIDDVISQVENVSNILLDWFDANYLQANPDKFQFILLHKHKLEYNVNIRNVILPSEDSVKLLGVHIDYRLDFNKHISETCSKAGRQLSALGRLSNVLNVNEKLLLFECFILSHFNFCPAVWHCCSISDMKKIEKIQKRALSHVFNDYVSSYVDLRQKANRPLLYVQRMKLIMIEVLKIVNKIGPKYLHDMFVLKNNSHNLRNSLTLIQPKFKTVTYGKCSLKYEGSVIWNKLSNEMKQSININVFKRFMRLWQGPNCVCFNCKLCSLNCM